MLQAEYAWDMLTIEMGKRDLDMGKGMCDQRLCDQFFVDTAVDLASALLFCMTRNDSIMHIGFNLQVK